MDFNLKFHSRFLLKTKCSQNPRLYELEKKVGANQYHFKFTSNEFEKYNENHRIC